MNHAIASYLAGGYWESTGRSARSFDVPANGELTVNITKLTPEGKQLARWALDAWEEVTDIKFREVSHNNADIMFDDDDAGAWSNSTVRGNTIIQSEVNVSTDWINTYGTRMDSYSYSTYLHEIGHALGLGHSGPYNGGYPVFFVDNAFLEDSWQMSVMSYINQLENPMIVADYAHPVTPMTADIIAIQDLYGKPDKANAGDTVYGANANVGDRMSEFYSIWTGERNPFNDVFTPLTQPTLVDLDGDGDLDLTALLIERIILIYKNEGTATEPDFRSSPGESIVWDRRIKDYEFMDLYENDGKIDLFVVDSSYIKFTNDIFNTDDNRNGSRHSGFSSDVEFVDIDGDDDLDMFLFGPHGIAFDRNIGTPEDADFSGDNIIIPSDVFEDMNDIKFADVDADGDYDLVMVDNYGTIFYAENIGTAETLDFADVTAHVNPLDAATYGDGPVHTIQDFSFGDIDGDGDTDMLSFDADGKIYYFENESGDTAFHFDPTTFNNQTTFTLYDTDGVDTIDLSTDTDDQVVRLGVGEISDVYGLVGNLIIGPDTVIENFTAGSGDDRIFGNEANNILKGNSGDDLLWGDAGNDTIRGGVGTDIINGGLGNDVLDGGYDDDVLSGGPGKDVFVVTTKNIGSLDLIMDFSQGEDKIHLASISEIQSVDDLPTLIVDDTLVIDLSDYNGGKIGLQGFTDDLSAADFVIA